MASLALARRQLSLFSCLAAKPSVVDDAGSVVVLDVVEVLVLVLDELVLDELVLVVG